VDFVCSDNHSGARQAAEQLVRSGCRRFGWLNYPASTWAGLQRGEAFLQALQQLGVDFRHICCIDAPEEGYDGGLQAAMSSEALPDGIFCANAQLACGFLDGMRQRGKEAPRDFHLIGFDNTPQSAQLSYRLTTLHQDVTEIARRALTRLLERAKNPLQPSRVEWVKVEMIHRHTSPQIG